MTEINPGWLDPDGSTDTLPEMTVVEVAPRDGLQNDPGDLSISDKAELVRRAVEAGIDRVEVTSFVSPRAAPKMADAESVVEAVRLTTGHEVSLSALVVNERGVMRAAHARVDEVNIVVVTTDAFSEANQGMTTAESLLRLPDLLSACRDARLRTSVSVAAAFGCPYEGEVETSQLVDVVAAVAAAGPDEINIADTIGVAVPGDVVSRVAAVRYVSLGIPLRAHFHNSRNTGIANALAAVTAGVRILDASIGGVGGCPFAPGATGNIATEDLVYALDRTGLRNGVELASIIDAARWLATALGHSVPGMLVKAGPFPR